MVSDMKMSPEILEEAVLLVAEQASRMYRPVNWMDMDEPSLWRELVSCLISSGVKFELSAAAMANLEEHGVLNVGNIKSAAPSFENQISDVLSEPVYFQHGSSTVISQKYRFPKSRANYIMRTAVQVYRSGSIKEILESTPNSLVARKQLINICVGIGPKQSSMFLRNVGHGCDLAIIDVHVERYLKIVGLTPDYGLRFGNLSAYEKVESVVQNYSATLGLSMQILDIAIWIVMRVAWKDFMK